MRPEVLCLGVFSVGIFHVPSAYCAAASTADMQLALYLCSELRMLRCRPLGHCRAVDVRNCMPVLEAVSEEAAGASTAGGAHRAPAPGVLHTPTGVRVAKLSARLPPVMQLRTGLIPRPAAAGHSAGISARI